MMSEYNTCGTCGATDGRAGDLIGKEGQAGECECCRRTRETGKVTLCAHLPRTKEEVAKIVAIVTEGKPTMTPIEQMSDAELVKAAAVEVMGWTLRGPYCGGTTWYCYDDPDGGIVADIPDGWNPLAPDGANDRDMVVNRMDEMGWLYEHRTYHRPSKHRIRFWMPRIPSTPYWGDAPNPGRAVLIAALKAVRAEKGGE